MPPKIKETIPQNASVNFTGKTIEFSFDEFVQVRDISNQLVITPQTREMPEVEARGKKIIVRFNEDLRPNTTYRLFFGNAIADMHEANALSNYEYVFSTGPSIDSLEITGRVINASDHKPEKDVTVALYDNNETDSVVFRKKPLYFTRTNEGGTYKLSYLPKSDFKSFAFTDKNKNLMYDGGDEMIAFRKNSISTATDSTNDLVLFKETGTKTFLKKTVSPYYGLAYIIYNNEQKNTVRPFYESQKNDMIAVDGLNDTCTVYYRNIYDTLKLFVHHPGKKTDSVSIMIRSKETFDRLKKENKLGLAIDITPMQNNAVPYYAKPNLQFNNWMDPDAAEKTRMELWLKGDSIEKTPLQIKSTGLNTFSIENKLLPGREYMVVLKQGAFKSRMGQESDSARLTFRMNEPSDYAVLNLKLLLPKKEKYIIQLMNDRSLTVAEQYTELSMTSSAEQSFRFRDLLPGNYFVRIVEDKNGNNKWDTGDVLNKKQPETIYFNAQAIKLLSDWDSETEWKVE